MNMAFCLCFGLRPSRKIKLIENSDNKSRHDKKSSSSGKQGRVLSGLETPLQDFDRRDRIFSYRELATATKNFKMESMIGRGGFGAVFKGRIDNGQNIAVKMLDESSLQGEKEFLVEVLMLSLLRHENLVRLFGYCAEGDQRLIVYEYMPLGSLEDHLQNINGDQEGLDWETRMQIAAGAAKGLEYLHNKADPPVIYRDLKSSNILLDHGYKPKLSDFGLAKLGPTGGKSHVSTRVMGTHGYCAPEYAISGKLTPKSDIYSFGVVMLELISGRKALQDSCDCVGSSRVLATWALFLYQKGEINQIVDPMLSRRGDYSESVVRKALEVAFMCLKEEADARPSISEVVIALDYIVKYTSTKRKKKNKLRIRRGGVITPKETIRMLTVHEEEEKESTKLERQRAVADAVSWAVARRNGGTRS